jgi:hypothetical protein
MNRIFANGNLTLCTYVIVLGRGYHLQSLSQVVQIYKHGIKEELHNLITTSE